MITGRLSHPSTENLPTAILRIACAAMPFAILAIGIGTMIATVRMIIKVYTPAIYWDQWQIFNVLIQSHDHPGWRELWIQHNEHRILTQRLLSFADLFWFGGRSISLLIETQAVQFLHLCLLIYTCRRFGNFRLPELIAISGALAYALFSPLQAENFYWGFQVAFVLVALCASASFAALIGSARQTARARSWLLFAVSIIAALVAEASTANGVLVWPFLSLTAFLLGLSRTRQLLLAVTGACAAAVYFIGYRSPSHHSNPLEAVLHPAQLLKYGLTCFGYSWNDSLPNLSVWPTVSESAVLLAIILLATLLVSTFRHPRSASSLSLFVLINGLFYLGTLGVMALGRLRFGYSQATAGRYQSFALIFWACILILVFSRLSAASLQTKTISYGLLLLLLFSSLSRFGPIQDNAMDRKLRLDQAWIAFLGGEFGSPLMANLFGSPPDLPAYQAYMVSHHLLLPPISDLQQVPARLNPRACQAWLDSASIQPKGDVSTAGWAYDAIRKTGAVRIVFADANGNIVGSTASGVPRPDVPRAVKTVHSEVTGWRCAWHAPHSGDYHLYVLINDQTACPVPGSIHIP